MLPHFLHSGASKCASSWLWRVCKEHPDIYVPPAPDNVNFFTVAWHRGLDWYEQTYFSDYAGEKVAGEFSNSYMVHELAQQRIKQHLPDVRLTITVRDPVRRAYLSWAHLHLKKRYGMDVDAGVMIPLEKVVHHHGHAWFRLWIEPGMYAFLLKRLYRCFDPEQVLVTFHEDLVTDPEGFLSRYFRFLGADPDFRPSLIGKQVNPDAEGADKWKGFPADAREELREVYREDILEFQKMTGRDLSHWLKE